MSLLSIEGLTLRFRGEAKNAVDDVSFEVEEGRTVALVGQSGSGKTLTSLSIPRLGPEAAFQTMSGSIRVSGEDVLMLDAAALRKIRQREIGVVFQDPAASLNPIMTVGRQIREVLADEKRLPALMEEVGLTAALAQRYPHELSGGQQQRIGIAIALAGDPRLLIADEPTTALDVTVQDQILDLLVSLQEARRMAMLFVSHDLGVVARLAHDIVVMSAGRVVETGRTHEVLTAPRSAEAKALLAARPSLEGSHPEGVDEHSYRDGSCAPLLKIENLVVRYRGTTMFSAPVDAVRSVGLTLAPGQSIGIVGESGSGKSSLAKAVVGLSPVHSGTVLVGGQPVGASRSRSDCRRAQYIFQDSYGSLNPRHTVFEIVGEPLAIHAIGTQEERRARVFRLLEEVGLPVELATRLPKELSGGQRQRVAIARALSLEPALLICDEIVSALDVSVQAQILELLTRLRARHQLALMFISHDLAVVAAIADEIVVMKDGKIVEQGRTAEVIAQPSSDYATTLVAAARRLETHLAAAS